MKNRKIPYIDPNDPLDKNTIITDPFGSYTGRPIDTQDLPLQDADDL